MISLQKIERNFKSKFLSFVIKTSFKNTLGLFLMIIIAVAATAFSIAPQKERTTVLLARDTISITQVRVDTFIKRDTIRQLKLMPVSKDLLATKSTSLPVTKSKGKITTFDDDNSWKRCKDNLYDIVSRSKKGEKFKGWDAFRFQVWTQALEIRRTYPDLGMDARGVYESSMKLLYHESRYDRTIKNKKGTAEGLFQVIASTKKSMGMPKNFRSLSDSEQLVWYKKYIIQHLKNVNRTKIQDEVDWYYLGLYPIHADKPDYTVFAYKWGNKEMKNNYRYNSGLDSNKDGIITKAEVGVRIKNIWK